MANKIYRITTSMGQSWKVTSQIRNHQLIIDQPSETDEGANPLETFLFSLGGCLSAIAKMVAREQKLTLNGIEIQIEAQLDTDGLLGKQDASVGFKEIKINALIDAEIPLEQKVAFFDLVCKRCPIHDNLLQNTQVNHQAD